MFNLFFRRYVPGFRVGPDGVPGFNIDNSSLLPRVSDSSEGTLPESATQRYPDAAQTQSPHSISFGLPGAEGWILSAPLIGSPGFSLSPQDDVPGFNVKPQDDAPGFNLDENGVPQPETTWFDGLRPGSVAPQALNVPQSRTPPQPSPPALPGGLPGLWVTLQDNLPGFHLKPQDEQIGFNLNENDGPPREGSSPGELSPEVAAPEYPDTTQTLSLPPGVEDSPPPVPSGVPDWVYNLSGAIPLPLPSSVFYPRTGPRIVPYDPLINPVWPYPTANQNTRRTRDARAYVPGISSSPGLGSSETVDNQRGTSFDMLERLAGINADSGAVTAQNTSSRPSTQEAIWNARPQWVRAGQTYTQAGGIDPSDPSRAELNAGDQGVQPLQQKTPLPQQQQTQQKVLAAPLGTGRANMSPTPHIGALPIEPSVYRPGNDAGRNLFDLVQGAPENRAQGLAAEAAELEAILKADREAKAAQQIRIYVEGGPSYMVADIVFSSAGVARVAIVEIKSGEGDLTPQQIEKLGEAVRTGKIYIVNEDAARRLRIKPRITFAAQNILPLVWVVGGNQQAIARQLRNQGLEVLPEGVGRRGRPARLLILPPT
jgi:hypothetical protein